MNYKKSNKIIFGLLIVFVNHLTFAQKPITLTNVKSITPVQSAGEMVGVTESTTNGEAIRFYMKNVLGQNVISKNHFSGRNMPIFESSVILESGQKTTLPANEEIAFFTDSKVYTIKHDWVADEIVVKSYSFRIGTLSNEYSRSFRHAETSANFTKNGYLVVSNALDGSGTTLEFFNENLDPVVTYKPAGGYSFYSADCNKDKLVLATGTSSKFSLAVLNANTGNIMVEKIIPMSGFSISQVFALENSIILYGINSQFVNYILCFDLNLNQMWTKRALMAQSNRGVFCTTNVDQTKFAYVTAFLNSAKQVAFKAICIEARTGKELWDYNILNNSQSSKSLPNYTYRGFYVTGFEYLPDKNSLAVTASNLFKSNESPPHYEYQDSRLIFLNDEGKVQESLMLGSGKQFILRRSGKLKVIGTEKTHFYE